MCLQITYIEYLCIKRFWGLNNHKTKPNQTKPRSVEISMPGISLREHIWSEVFRELSRMKDVIPEYRMLKFCQARRIAYYLDNKWTRAVVEFYSKDRKLLIKRPPRWWRDEIVKWVGPTWTRSTRAKTK